MEMKIHLAISRRNLLPENLSVHTVFNKMHDTLVRYLPVLRSTTSLPIQQLFSAFLTH